MAPHGQPSHQARIPRQDCAAGSKPSSTTSVILSPARRSDAVSGKSARKRVTTWEVKRTGASISSAARRSRQNSIYPRRRDLAATVRTFIDRAVERFLEHQSWADATGPNSPEARHRTSCCSCSVARRICKGLARPDIEAEPVEAARRSILHHVSAAVAWRSGHSARSADIDSSDALDEACSTPQERSYGPRALFRPSLPFSCNTHNRSRSRSSRQ